MRFESDRLVIRSPILDDANDIFENYTTDPQVTRYLTWSPHHSIEDTRKFINYCIENSENAESFILVIFHKENKKAIGMINFKIDGFSSEFGYVLSKRYWNNGIMTEALKPVIDFVYRMPEITFA